MKKMLILLLAFVLAACGEFRVEGQFIAPTATLLPTATPEPEPSPTLTPMPLPTVTPQPLPSPTPMARLLPAPLYFINAKDNQIWRMEVDGAALTQITHELAPVVSLDVSPVDGGLVYVSNNTLIRAASDGTNRVVLVDGGWVDPQDPGARFTKQLLNPRWRPTGEEIVFGQAGVNVIAADGAGGPHQMLASSPYPAAGAAPTNEAFYEPVSYSPDGRWLLVSKAFYPEGGEYLLLLLNTGAAPIPLRSSMSPACCQLAWVGQTLYLANHQLGMFEVGLWRAEVPSGEFVPVVSNNLGTPAQPAPADQLVHFVAFPFGSQEQVFAFAASRPNTAEIFQTQTLLTLSRVAPDGRLTPLRGDGFIIGEALGAPDASGAVIMDINAHPNQYPPIGELRWLSASHTPAVDLQVQGSQMRWGK